MECAMKDVEDNSYSIRAAAKKWGIPASTLTYWLLGLTTTKRRGPPTILSLEEELEIVDWCKDMAQLGHGLEIIQLKLHVAHICETRPNPFKNGFPGRSWWTGFRKRHPDLTIRVAEGLDRDRAVMLRPSIMTDFYDNLEKLYNASEYGPTKIWNCDETGHRILGFYLFKAKRQLKNYIANCEPGACMAAQPHAWMTKELFLNWLYHFARFVTGGVSPTNIHLLIFDSHRSHVALTTIHEAKSLGIDLLALSAHTSHKLQPLDLSVFSPFKAHFKSERSKWMAKHPHIEIRRTELAELASKAFKLALTSENIIAGFQRTRIWPLNKNDLCNDMRPSDAFNLQDDNDATSIASILRLAGFGEAHVEECLEQCFEPPNWIKEGAKHLGIQIDMENEEVSLSMPSPPMLSSEVIHYYVDTMDSNNSNLETNEVAEDEQDEHNQGSLKIAATFEIEDKAEEMLCSQGSLKKILKLPIERVRNRSSLLSNNNALKLGSKSQILTSNEYIIREQKKEARKAKIEELKVRKKKQKEARKLEQIARRKRKDEEKIERQIIK
ncbi:uncharacterized protein LOC131874281 [Cryptomeria japonica]|uniref:uncharacterized protein LOC131874281 n=1 Tax=Cryptomeria japonica TaxID=3369 RepID=UPI0027DA9FD8|nr:uncharacterized protein LOC131874281 [Cryptomeria japonica]